MFQHAAIQGTARPAHYFVIHDEIFRRSAGSQKKAAAGMMGGNEEDTLEQVTQSLCYVYGRSTRAVSICTPAYYADIVCERARRYLVSNTIKTSPISYLFFLLLSVLERSRSKIR